MRVFLAILLGFNVGFCFAEDLTDESESSPSSSEESISVEQPKPIAQPVPPLDPIGQIKLFLDQGAFVNAYQLAKSLQFDLEGDVTFDFLFAVSAIEMKDYDSAIFALERVIELSTNKQRAQLELGRAFFYSENLLNARLQFNLVLQGNPPESVKLKINEFLAAIDEKENQIDPSWIANFGLDTGFDSNFNNGAKSDVLDPALNIAGLTNIEEDSLAKSDGYINLYGSAGIILPKSKTASSQWLFNANLQQPINQSELNSAQFGLSLNTHNGTNAFSVDANGGYQLALSNWKPSQQSLLLGMQISSEVTPTIKLTTSYFTNIAFAFDGIGSINDQAKAELAIKIGKLSHKAAFNYNRLELQDLIYDHNSSKTLGIHYGATMTFIKKLTQTVNFDYAWQPYAAQELIFLDPENPEELIVRLDQYLQLASQSTWNINDVWRANLGLNAKFNNSNVSAYEYTKFKVQLGASASY